MKRTNHFKKIKSLNKFYNKVFPQYESFELPLSSTRDFFGMSIHTEMHTTKHKYNKRPKNEIMLVQR